MANVVALQRTNLGRHEWARWGHKFTVCDDNVYIYEKPQIVSGLTWEHVVWAFSDAHEGNWHPLTWISHMLDWQLFSGGSWEPANQRYKTSWPGGHHLVSMLHPLHQRRAACSWPCE